MEQFVSLIERFSLMKQLAGNVASAHRQARSTFLQVSLHSPGESRAPDPL